MISFVDTVVLILQSFWRALWDVHFWLVFLFVVGLIALQYRRMWHLRESFYRQKTGEPWADVALAAGLGLLGGLLGSILMALFGVTISGKDMIYLWPIALLLVMINIRFLCFAYSGGILAAFSVLFGFPSVNIPQILALVAVLHMVESVLILFSGHLGALPAYFKDGQGRVVGGFALQRFWPIPLIMSAMLQSGSFQLMPVVAGLGYSDLALTRSPVAKSRLSALFLGMYSIILLALAVLAAINPVFSLAAALFSPLGHELIIYISKRLEFVGKALYVSSPFGLRVLDVIPYMAAWRAGIRSGDILLTMNSRELVDKESFYQTQLKSFLPFVVGYFSYKTGETRRCLVSLERQQEWGMMLVPEGNEEKYVELSATGPLGNWVGKLWAKLQN